MYFTNESEASEDDSYLGYSTAAGDFDGDGQSDVAVGMPRGANLTGKVRFTNDLFIYLLLFEKKKKKLRTVVWSLIFKQGFELSSWLSYSKIYDLCESCKLSLIIISIKKI